MNTARRLFNLGLVFVLVVVLALVVAVIVTQPAQPEPTATVAPPATATAVSPTVQPTVLPSPLPGRKFDDRTEAYLDALELAPTGAMLVEFLRTTTATLSIQWVPFAPESSFDGLTTPEGIIYLASNKLADLINDEASWGEMIYGAGVLAHETTHFLMQDPGTPEALGEGQEKRAYMVELKVVCELLARLENKPVDYYRSDVWSGFELVPEKPWDLERLLAGATPLDEDVARQVLWFPEPPAAPSPAPVATPTPLAASVLAQTRLRH